MNLLEEMRSTNYSVVHETLLKDLFQLRYLDGKTFIFPGLQTAHKLVQLTLSDATGKAGRHIVVPNTDIIKVEPTPSSVKITAKNLITNEDRVEEFDFLFVGIGYQRGRQVDLLKQHFADRLFPLTVRRDYSVWSRDPEFKAGLYLQGMTEGSHGMSDSVLSVMSVRSDEVLRSVLRRKAGWDWSPEEKVNKVQVSSRDDGLVWGI